MAAHAWGGCWRLETKGLCPVIGTCCVYQLCFMLAAGPWQGWHVVLRSMCQWVLLLGHYRVLKAAQLKSGMTIYVMYIILHYVTPILSAVCSTRCRLPATAGSIACMCYILAHVYLFHKSWPPIHRHCYTPAEASHKDTPTQRGHHRQHWAIPAAIYTWNNKIQCNLLLSLHSTLVQDSSAISWNWFRCKEERIFTSCHDLCWLCASAVWPHAELIMIMLTLRSF